jgi:hypothetical protein
MRLHTWIDFTNLTPVARSFNHVAYSFIRDDRPVFPGVRSPKTSDSVLQHYFPTVWSTSESAAQGKISIKEESHFLLSLIQSFESSSDQASSVITHKAKRRSLRLTLSVFTLARAGTVSYSRRRIFVSKPRIVRQNSARQQFLLTPSGRANLRQPKTLSHKQPVTLFA